jgi:hypothetical protein
MYAYASVPIERPNVWTLPRSALDYSGDKTFCWIFDNGRAVRTEIRTGIGDEEWVEILSRRVPDANGKARTTYGSSSAMAANANGRWAAIDGSAQVIVGDLSSLANGESVRLAKATGEQ